MWTAGLMAVLLLQECMSVWSGCFVNMSVVFSYQDWKLQPDHPSGISLSLMNNKAQICCVNITGLVDNMRYVVPAL